MFWDIEIFRMLNQTWVHPWLDLTMPLLTDKNTYLAPGIFFILWVLLWGQPRHRKILLFLILCVAAMDILSSRILKPLINRPRPGWTLEDVRLLIGVRHSGSMPSSHAANLMAAWCFLLGMRISKTLLAGLLAFVVVVSYSRVYLGVHYPSDILAGWALGIGWATCFLKLPFVKRQKPEANQA